MTPHWLDRETHGSESVAAELASHGVELVDHFGDWLVGFAGGPLMGLYGEWWTAAVFGFGLASNPEASRVAWHGGVPEVSR